MQFVVQISHPPDQCPTANAKARQFYEKMGRELPNLATRLGVKVVTGPFVLGSSHQGVMVVQAEKVETVNDLAMQSGLVQWNSVTVSQAIPMEEALKETAKLTPVY